MLARVAPSTALADALADADFVVEAVPEQEALKAAVLREADAAAPAHAILASNTSSISITRLAANTRRPEACVGVHFMVRRALS